MKSRKEIKEEYKQMKFLMGVFQLKNSSTNKVLIDNSEDMDSKYRRHLMELKFGSHRNKALQKDWNTLGEDNFSFEVLSVLKHDEEKIVDYQKELKLLQHMIEEELSLDKELKY